MPVYEYRVRDRLGKMLKSQMEAETIGQVRDALRAKNMLIVEIKAPKTGMNADIKIPGLSNRPPGLKAVSVFSKQLATLISSGVPLVQALAILQRQIENKALQGIVEELRVAVETGHPLSESLTKYPKTFNRLYVNLVRAGETSGMLDQTLERVSAFQEKDLALRGRIKSALTYPVMVLIFSLGITYFLLTVIVPQFGNMLIQLNAPLPTLTQVLMAISSFLQNSVIFLVIGIVALVFLYRRYYSTPKGRLRIDTIKLRIPILGNLLQKSSISSFARTLSLLITSGVNIIESLEITKGTANNAVVEESIDNAKNIVIIGDQMSSSLATSKIFPPMVVSMVSIGEETGTLDSMLEKVGDFYDREVDEAVDSMTAAIEPIMIIFLGTIIGTIVAGMFLPMFSIIGQLNK